MRGRRTRSSMIGRVQATLSWIGEEWLGRAVRDEIALCTASGSGVTSRASASLALRPAPENLRVRLPLRFAVPGRLDANVDMDLRFTVSARYGTPSVWLYQSVADIGWANWGDPHALPAVESVLRTLLRAFVGRALERRFVTTLAEAVRRLCPSEEGLALSAMWMDENAVQFRCSHATRHLMPVMLRAFPEVPWDGREVLRELLKEELALN